MKLISECFLFCLVITGTAAAEQQSVIQRGLYLVTAAGCNDCHSPKKMTATGPVPDQSLLLSGHPSTEELPAIPQDVIGPGRWGALANNNFTAWVGPWGVSYAPNLTPDPETGTGSWDQTLFMRVMRTGKLLGAGRPILPPMPWPEFAKLSDQDLSAIFAYLKSIKPVRNLAPDSVPAIQKQ